MANVINMQEWIYVQLLKQLEEMEAYSKWQDEVIAELKAKILERDGMVMYISSYNNGKEDNR